MDIIMEEYLEKISKIFRSLFLVLWGTVAPFVIYAGGIPDLDPKGYTVAVQGRVISEQEGKQIRGIDVQYNPSTYTQKIYTKTDREGYFFLCLPEYDLYNISFRDIDGFENDGFFTQTVMNFTRDNVKGTLEIRLFREIDVSVIRGTVFSKETDKPIPRVRFHVSSDGDDSMFGFNAAPFDKYADNTGQFYIEVPVRSSYSITFFDLNGPHKWKMLHLTSVEINEPLNVIMEYK
ncbi:hypothetical protein FACS1894161_4390 [Spirochaetia bacterium]|nr:hypothetical protein FACS1894161_4390 [Spirochaetia bacterium]